MAKLLTGITFGIGLLFAPAVLLANDTCSYEGTAYSEGAAVCQSGTQYRCDDGEWENMGFACSENFLMLSSSCDLGGNAYSSGATSCQGGTQFRCDNGRWENLGVSCAIAGDEPLQLQWGPSGRTCLIDGATVSNRSTICRNGVTFLCDDGSWENIGAPCR